MNFFDYHHFPVYSIMVLFLGAFLIVLLGKNKTVRNFIAFAAMACSVACMVALVKPVMLNGEIIAYWMGNRAIAGGYAIGIALEVDALSLFFGLLISSVVFVAGIYSFQYMAHDDIQQQYYTL